MFVQNKSSGGNDASAETAEEEMGLAGAAAEDAEAEYIRKITETEIVTGSSNLLAVLRPLVVMVCSNPSKFNDPDLHASAALALAKYMIVRLVVHTFTHVLCAHYASALMP